MTLTEFLLARIAEDEAVARAAVWSDPDPEWDGVDTWDAFVSRGEMLVGPNKGNPTEAAVVSGPFKGGLHMQGDHLTTRNSVVAEHVACHDPARVLAECEAKRRIVELHRYDDLGNGEHSCAECDFGGYSRSWCGTLRALALPYADHRDYRYEWRP